MTIFFGTILITLLVLDIILHTVATIVLARCFRPAEGWMQTIKAGIEHKKRYFA